MALALNNLRRVDMPLNKETKPELFEIELIISIKMDLALNNQQRLICLSNQPAT